MPAITAAYTSVSAKEMGDAATLVNIVQRIGGAIGGVGMVIILQQAGGAEKTGAYLWAFGSLAGLSILTLAAGAALRRQVHLEEIRHGAK